MASLGEGISVYQATGKVVTLAVCGMERKVQEFMKFARVFHVLSGRLASDYIWLIFQHCLYGCAI